MLAAIKRWFERRRVALAAQSAEVAKFDALTDPTYLDRATAKGIVEIESEKVAAAYSRFKDRRAIAMLNFWAKGK